MQHGKPVTSISMALQAAERKYTFFAPVLGMERNQQYVLAKKAILGTDQKPLVFFTHEPQASASKARTPFCGDFSNMTTRCATSLGKVR